MRRLVCPAKPWIRNKGLPYAVGDNEDEIRIGEGWLARIGTHWPWAREPSQPRRSTPFKIRLDSFGCPLPTTPNPPVLALASFYRPLGGWNRPGSFIHSHRERGRKSISVPNRWSDHGTFLAKISNYLLASGESFFLLPIRSWINETFELSGNHLFQINSYEFPT